MDKYKVLAIAYKDVDERVLRRVCNNSIRDISSLEDLENVYDFCDRGFDLSNRVCTYMEWFKNDFKEKIKRGYSISVHEMPCKEGIYGQEIMDLVGKDYGDDLQVIGKVNS